jgi:NAD-dependent SIR2 family protein deacetylase/TPR repeat protein
MTTIDNVVNSLRRAKEDRGAVVLLGAGCSKSAGIPLAGELMQEITREFGPIPAGLTGYAEYMNFVAPGERRKLLSKYIDEARINWAHIALAQLIASHYIKCILTTNFDPLIVRACAMLGSFPAVYDVPSTKYFDPAEVVDPSIFYLHGQRTGFVMLHTNDEFKQNTLDAVFRRAGERRPWIVIGYSGNSDPVFDQLASYERFDYRLFWIGYRDDPASQHVNERLLTGNKYADYIGGYDADTFFVSLAKKLGVFPPALFAEPLKHLRQTITVVNPFNFPGHGKDLRDLADKQTERATHLLEAESGQRAAMANSLVVANKYEQLLGEFRDEADASPEIAEAVAWGWLLKGLASMDAAEAEGIEPDAADKLLLEAIRCYEEALNLHPQFPDAHFNWGYALSERSKLKSGDDATKRLFDEARAHYATARDLDPNDHEVYYNLGNLLGDRADVVEDEAEAIALLREAVEQYDAALKINPEDADILINLAATLKTLAGKVDDPKPILQQANAAYDSSLSHTGDWSAAVLADWGEVLDELGEHLQAENVWRGADTLEKGCAAYHLARLFAKRGDHEEAKKWLLEAREAATLPPIDDVKDDPAFESLRELDWFKDFTR